MYDYVIAGGGAAGCVLAARLSEAGASVLLLEAGHPDSHPFIHIPAGFTKLSGPKVNWGYRTVPQTNLNGRDMWYPQGKTLGGGSSINAMIYTRGHRTDYDKWADSGAKGWAYENVLPYFRKAEANARFANRYHGTEGPLAVSDPISPLKISAAFIKAAQEAGIPYNPDFNGAEQEGVGFHQTTTRDGRRGSASVSYLRPARDRKNLTVVTRAEVSRVILEKGRAVAVEYRQDGSPALQRASAATEVIVTGGAIGSPKLLMLSGIGPAAHLRQHGIPVMADLAGVGENLQDHLDCYTVYDCSGPHSYYGVDQHVRQAWWGLQYILFRSGPVTTNIVEAGAFVKADPRPRGRADAGRCPGVDPGRPPAVPRHQVARRRPGRDRGGDAIRPRRCRCRAPRDGLLDRQTLHRRRACRRARRVSGPRGDPRRPRPRSARPPLPGDAARELGWLRAAPRCHRYGGCHARRFIVEGRDGMGP